MELCVNIYKFVAENNRKVTETHSNNGSSLISNKTLNFKHNHKLLNDLKNKRPVLCMPLLSHRFSGFLNFHQ